MNLHVVPFAYDYIFLCEKQAVQWQFDSLRHHSLHGIMHYKKSHTGLEQHDGEQRMTVCVNYHFKTASYLLFDDMRFSSRFPRRAHVVLAISDV